MRIKSASPGSVFKIHLNSILHFMNIKPIAIILFTLTFTSCSEPRTQEKEKEKNETPKALEDKNSLEVISKRGGDVDLVDALYSELLEKRPDLKELEMRIADLSKTEGDSTGSFRKYDAKSNSYYILAKTYTNMIKDSILKVKINAIIKSSLTKYDSSIERQNAMLDEIASKNIRLSDLHVILKITETLPMIEKYQQDNLPSIKPMDGFLKRLNGTIEYTDSISKK